MDRMTSYFIGKTYATKTVHIHLDPDSETKRMDRARGVAVHNVHETMRIVTSQWPRKDMYGKKSLDSSQGGARRG
jgi:hypothetical protein